MTKAIYNLGVQFCDAVEAFAPRTRSRRVSGTEMTASSLLVRADRLRRLLARAYEAGRADDALFEIVTRILDLLAAWSTSRPFREEDEGLRLARECGELFLELNGRHTVPLQSEAKF